MATFAGQYNATIDDKGRVVLPSAFKKAMDESERDFVVLERNSQDSCLDIHVLSDWKERVAKIEAKAKLLKAEGRILREVFFRSFKTVSVAANGRINIPDDYLSFAGIKDKVSFLGMNTLIRLRAAADENAATMSEERYLELMRMIEEGEI